MSVMLWSIETSKTAVNTVLKDFFADKSAAAKRLDQDYYRLWDITGRFVLSGGKRLRPHLCIMAYQAFGGSDPQSVINVAAAQELLHVCLLIHDDIIDRDFVRYGIPNISGQYQTLYDTPDLPAANTTHLANGAALLAGDLLLSEAYGLIADSQLTPQQIKLAQQELRAAMFHVAGGELLDTEAVLKPIPDVDTTKIMDLKTAYYSCAAPLRSGALLAGVSKQDLVRLEKFAKHLGIAYQLTDDLLGVFGDTATIGKPTSSDIQEAKRTHLLQITLQKASKADSNYILGVLGDATGTVSQSDVTRIRSIMQQSGAVADIEQDIQKQLAAAIDALQHLKVAPEYRQAFQQLAESVISSGQRSISSFGAQRQ